MTQIVARGSRPFARLKMSANAPFTAGVDKFIPFDVVDAISDSFGVITFTNQPPVGANPIFACQYGIYLVQMQIQVDTSPTSMTGVLVCASSSAADSSAIRTGSGFSALALSLNANRKNTELRLPGTPTAFPNGIYSVLSITGGGNGLIFASGTQMLIQQLTTY